MIRLHLTVEGKTEQAFVAQVLRPHLANFGVMIGGARLTGPERRRRGRIPGGGFLGTFHHTLRDIQTWTKEDRSPEARFSTLVDLYGLPRDFPGYESGILQPAGQAQALELEAALARAVGDARFIPHLQLHEFEALVLVAPERLADYYELVPSQLRALQDECRKFSTPEEINHGQHSHPKARILKYVPGYTPLVAGPAIAVAIGLATLREKCPHFGGWLTSLENLGGGPA